MKFKKSNIMAKGNFSYLNNCISCETEKRTIRTSREEEQGWWGNSVVVVVVFIFNMVKHLNSQSI